MAAMVLDSWALIAFFEDEPSAGELMKSLPYDKFSQQTYEAIFDKRPHNILCGGFPRSSSASLECRKR